MKILLLGNTGQLGGELEQALYSHRNMVSLDYPTFDLVDTENVRKTIREVKPDLILNATAYTAVDNAELEPDLAKAINFIGPGVLAEEARNINAFLVHYSTDYVFDGLKKTPYNELDQPTPINIYGSTKLMGEKAIQQVDGNYFIFRTSWVYTLQSENFVTKVLRWSREQESLRIVDDQISNPTWARMLAEATIKLISLAGRDFLPWLIDHKGLYHLAGNGYASRFEWAKEILKNDPESHEQIFKEIIPASTAEFPSASKRPSFSALDCSKFQNAFKIQLPGWEKSLRLAMQKSKPF